MRKTFKQELENIKKELAQCKDDYLRALADFDNYRKRMQKEKEESIKFANQRLIMDFIPVLDTFEQGLHSLKNIKVKGSKKFYTGVELIYKNLMSILEREGLKRFSGVGKEFDPRFHEAVEIKETEKYPPNHIISEIVCGYKLNDRIIRPAKVIVSKKPSKK